MQTIKVGNSFRSNNSNSRTGRFFLRTREKLLKLLEQFSETPGKALEIAANVGTAVANKTPGAIAANAPDVITSLHQGKELHLGKNHKKFLYKNFYDIKTNYYKDL